MNTPTTKPNTMPGRRAGVPGVGAATEPAAFSEEISRGVARWAFPCKSSVRKKDSLSAFSHVYRANVPPAERGTPELSAPRKRVCLWPEPIPPGQRIYEIATNTAGNAVPAGKMILEEIVIELE